MDFISVDSKMPRKGLTVLCLLKNGDIITAKRDDTYLGNFKREILQGCYCCVKDVVGWSKISITLIKQS